MNEHTSALDIFKHPDFDIAVTKSDGGGLIFGAAELAQHLGARDAHNLIRPLPERYKGYSLVSTPGGDQRVWYVTEPGLYQLLAQRQPSRIRNREMRAHVEGFQAWIFEEVLPTLRRAHEHGIDAIGELKERVAYLEDELETERMTTDSEHIRNRKAFLDGVKAGRANPDVAYGLSAHFRQWEQG